MSFGQPALCGNLLLTKNVDKASAPLAMLAIRGGFIDKAVLTGQLVGSPGVDFFRMTLQGVSILSLSISDNSGAPPAIEQVSLKAQFIHLEYNPLTAARSLGPASVADINCTR